MRLDARRRLLGSSCSRVVSISETPDPLFSYSNICGCLPHRLARRFYYLLQGHDTICVSRSSWKHHEKRNMNSSCSIWWLNDFTQASKSKFTVFGMNIFYSFLSLFPCFFLADISPLPSKPNHRHLICSDLTLGLNLKYISLRTNWLAVVVWLTCTQMGLHRSVCVFF